MQTNGRGLFTHLLPPGIARGNRHVCIPNVIYVARIFVLYFILVFLPSNHICICIACAVALARRNFTAHKTLRTVTRTRTHKSVWSNDFREIKNRNNK